MEVGLGGAGPSMVNEFEEDDELVELPPGFRFHPTDEEIIMHYLLQKVIDRRFVAKAIGEADLNKCEPWDLPKKAKMGEKEWFFFCQRDRKYPTGMRTNRATESGYWKATGKDKEIHRARNCLVGMKKTLVFYKGRAPKGEKTNWVMHEFRLEGNFSGYNFSRAAKEEFVVCRVFHKNSGIRRSPGVELSRADSFVDRLWAESPTALPPLAEYSCFNEGPSSSSYGAAHHQQGSNSNSSRLFWNNHTVQRQYDLFAPPQTYPMTTTGPFSIPQIALPASSFPPTLGYNQQQQQNGLSYDAYDDDDDETKNNDVRRLLVAPKMENFSSNNSVMSHSQDTGLSTDQNVVANHEITSKKAAAFDHHNHDQGLDISDLDSLWSY